MHFFRLIALVSIVFVPGLGVAASKDPSPVLAKVAELNRRQPNWRSVRLQMPVIGPFKRQIDVATAAQRLRKGQAIYLTPVENVAVYDLGYYSGQGQRKEGSSVRVSTAEELSSWWHLTGSRIGR